MKTLDPKRTMLRGNRTTTMKCPHCIGVTHLDEIQDAGAGVELRRFLCESCTKQTTVTVDA
jgi:hypothetical protein